PHGAGGLRQAGNDRGAVDRKQGKARRTAQGHHYGRIRLLVAGTTAAWVSGNLSGRVDLIAAGRCGVGSGHAGGRCGDSHAPSETAGPDSTASDDVAVACVRVTGIPEAPGRAAAAGGTGCASADPVRPAPPAGAGSELVGGSRAAARQSTASAA